MSFEKNRTIAQWKFEGAKSQLHPLTSCQSTSNEQGQLNEFCIKSKI